MTYHPANRRPGLGTRDLLESIERDRRARVMRGQAFILGMAALALTGAYAASLGLTVALEYIHHLF